MPAGIASAIEEPDYEVVSEFDGFEVRRYGEIVLAETRVVGDFEAAGNTAFRRLFGYISGGNRSQAKIDMTAPVVQEGFSEKIAMTAPVKQEGDDDGWRVAFVVPKKYSWHDAPEPRDSEVSLRLVPERTVAVVQFSGRWDEDRFRAREAELLESMAGEGLVRGGPTVFARYDPPFKPWFLRRNEVLIPLEDSGLR